MGTYSTFCVEVKTSNEWKINRKEIFDFSPDAWQRKPGDTSDQSAFPFTGGGRSVYAFLGGVRNEFGCVPLSEPRGLPEDISDEALEIFAPGPWTVDGYGGSYEAESVSEKLQVSGGRFYGFSWLMADELLGFYYEQSFVDVSELPHVTRSYREFLGEGYMQTIEALRTLGEPANVRLVFAFE